ncbi:hypothetical protein BC941DRAFT_452649 [Chlamydoabsidia padenii]|nr:hypothetical protein BC941DRAFT_452649 [Chlamydoabsidia padenii]
MDLDVEAMLEAPFREKQSNDPVDRVEHGQQDERRQYDGHERSPSRSHRSHSRHRSHYRSPSYERRRSHSRSHRDDRYRDDRRRYGSRDGYRHRSRSPRRRSHSRDRYSSSRRNGHRERSYSPPVPLEERDRRTVFVTQLAQRLKNREFLDFFSQAGRVRDARIISDRNTRRSKGVGYIEFYDESSVQTALAMSGQKLLGIPVNVQLTEAEKNRLALQNQQNMHTGIDVNATQIASLAAKPPAHDIMDQRLYVGSINYTLTEHDLRQVFEPYGPIDFVDLHKDLATGRSKGYAFIQFRNVKDAKEALTKMNGFELAGRNLKVGMVTEKSQQPNGGSYSNLGNDSGPLDDDSAGMTLNSMSRAELMRKLAARETDLMSAAEKVTQSPPVNVTAPVIIPSRTILLNNMFNPAEETEPDWVRDLSVDIKEECQQYGNVEHIFVNPDSLGEVSLKFDTVGAGQKAIQSLNGRWFGGRQIQAIFMPEHEYNQRFPA